MSTRGPTEDHQSPGKGLVGIILIAAIVAALVAASREVFQEDRQAKEIAEQMVENDLAAPIVQALRQLSQRNAYTTGRTDGAAAYTMLVRGHQKSPTTKEKRLFAQVKHEVFERIESRRTDYGVPASILADYRRGWMEGFEG